MAASVSVPRLSSEFGSGRGGWGPQGQITRESIPITSNAVDAVITVGAAQATPITIQLTNADGSAIAHAQDVDVWVFADALRAALATTGGSTGIAIGASGYIAYTQTSKKVFRMMTTAAGLLAVSWTDNASEAAFLGVRIPSGRWVMSSALPTT